MKSDINIWKRIKFALLKKIKMMKRKLINKIDLNRWRHESSRESRQFKLRLRLLRQAGILSKNNRISGHFSQYIYLNMEIVEVEFEACWMTQNMWDTKLVGDDNFRWCKQTKHSIRFSDFHWTTWNHRQQRQQQIFVSK